MGEESNRDEDVWRRIKAHAARRLFELRIGGEVVAEVRNSGHILIHRQLEPGEFFKLVEALGEVGETLAGCAPEPVSVGLMVDIQEGPAGG